MDRKPTKNYQIHYSRLAAALAALFVVVVIIVFIAAGGLKKESTDDGSTSADASDSSHISKPDNSKSSDDSSSDDSSSDDSSSDESEKEDFIELNVPPGAHPLEGEHGMEDLKKQITNKFSEYSGEWSAYIKNLNTGEYFTINNKQIYPASMIKLFATGAAYQQIEEGLINENDYLTYIHGMAVMSNNVAFNKMVWTLGRGYITKWCQENGYTRTAQYHGLLPADNAEGLATSEKRNETCASDVGKMLESIYNGKCVSKESSKKILDLLKDQHWRNKIPSGLPPGVVSANKTGDTEDQSHDAAIVYSKGADYIIVIMSENPDVSFEQDYKFIELSRMVYNYFNP